MTVISSSSPAEVVIADDMAICREFIKQAPHSEKYSSVEVVDGNNALEKIFRQEFDVFNAPSSEQVCKEAFPLERAKRIFLEEGSQECWNTETVSKFTDLVENRCGKSRYQKYDSDRDEIILDERVRSGVIRWHKLEKSA